MFDKQLKLLEQTVNQLTALLDEETHSIITHQMDKVVALRPRKREISDFLSSSIPAITSSSEWKELPQNKTTHLKEIVTKVRQKLEENKRALEIAEKGQEIIVTVIRDAAKAHQAPSTSYSEKGKIGEPPPTDVSLVLNENV